MMISTKKRSPVSPPVSKTAVDQATLSLKKLPDKPKEIWSLKEAIELMQTSITATLDKGYTHEEVADILRTQGVDINVPSLKYYLATARRKARAADHSDTKQPRKEKNTAALNPTESQSDAPLPASTNQTTESSEKTGIAGVISFLMDDAQSSPSETPRSRSRSSKKVAAATQPEEQTAPNSTAPSGKKRTSRPASKPEATPEVQAATPQPAAKAKPRTAAKTTRAASTSSGRRQKKETP